MVFMRNFFLHDFALNECDTNQNIGNKLLTNWHSSAIKFLLLIDYQFISYCFENFSYIYLIHSIP
jgi:hypothetical protein